MSKSKHRNWILTLALLGALISIGGFVCPVGAQDVEDEMELEIDDVLELYEPGEVLSWPIDAKTMRQMATAVVALADASVADIDIAIELAMQWSDYPQAKDPSPGIGCRELACSAADLRKEVSGPKFLVVLVDASHGEPAYRGPPRRAKGSRVEGPAWFPGNRHRAIL